jgi:hypothetical protein
MKKNYLIKFFLVCIVIGQVSCSKYNENKNPKDTAIKTTKYVTLKNGTDISVSTDGNVLIFKTVEDYEKAFQADDNLNDEELRTQQNNIYEIIQNLNFDKFLNSTCYQNLINSVGEDEYPLFVFKILNKDGIVQIGNFLFKLDFINRKAYSLPIEQKNQKYNELKFGQYDQINIIQYSWDKEVIYEAHGVAYKLGCNENSASVSDDTFPFTDLIEWDFLLSGNIFNGQYNAAITNKKFDGELKAKYRWTPIGWDLYSKVILRQKERTLSVNTASEISWSSSWSTANIPVKLEWQRRYKLKCKNDTGYQSLTNYGTGVAVGQSWQGIRACHKYVLGARAYVMINGNWEYLNFNTPSKNVNGTLYQVRINSGY